MKTTKIGIDLGTYSIKIAVIEEVSDIFSGKYLKMYKVNSYKNEKEYFKFVKKCIKDFTKTFKIQKASLSFSIPYNIDSIKFFKMPMVDKKLLQKSIKYEINEKDLIDDLEANYFKWDIIESDNELAKDYDIILTVIKKEIIKYLSGIKSVKWQIENVEFQPLSIGRLIQDNTAVIDFGHSSTRVYMYRNGNLTHIETLDFGGQFINDIIKNFFGLLNDKDAEDIKNQVFITNDLIDIDCSDEIRKISEKITEEVSDIFKKIKMLVRGFELQNETIIENLYCLGGTSDILYFKELLSREFEINVRTLEIITPAEDNGFPISYKNYTIASAAILHKKYKYFKELNFSKYTVFQIDLTPIVVGFLLASIVIHAGTFYINKNYDENINTVRELNQEQTKTIDTLSSDISKINQEILKNQKTIIKVNELQQQQKWLSDILFILPDKVPEDTIVSNINCKDGAIIIDGYSKNYSDIGFFAIALEEIGQVTIKSIDNQAVDTIYPIDITKIKSNVEPVDKTFQIVLNSNQPLLDHSN